MVNYYLLYMKLPGKDKKYRKWPLRLHRKDGAGYASLETIHAVEAWLSENNKIYYTNEGEDDKFQALLKSQILTIIGPIPIGDNQYVAIQDIYTLNEAAKLWGLADGSTIRKTIERGKFTEREAKKSESTWLVTSPGMVRLFGPLDEEKYEHLVINRIVYDVNTGKFKIEKALGNG